MCGFLLLVWPMPSMVLPMHVCMLIVWYSSRGVLCVPAVSLNLVIFCFLGFCSVVIVWEVLIVWIVGIRWLVRCWWGGGGGW